MRIGFRMFAAVLLSIAATTAVSAQDSKRYYLSGSLSADFLEMEATGFNTSGGFDASGIEHETNEAYGFSFGREVDYCDYQIRLESQYLFLEDSQFTLNSFPGLPGPISFFYRGAVTDRWASLTNLWIDRPISDNFEVYAGGGLGVSFFEFAQTDSVVESRKDDEDIAYQFGVGLTCKLLSNVELDFGYRRMNLGNANTNLFDVGGTNPAGNLNVDLDSDQLMLSMRIFRR